jgi:hypothetical protein
LAADPKAHSHEYFCHISGDTISEIVETTRRSEIELFNEFLKKVKSVVVYGAQPS